MPAFLADLNWYAPDQAWREAAEELVGTELVDALSVFAESVTISPLTPEQPQAMLDLVAPFSENRLPYTPNPAPRTSAIRHGADEGRLR